MPRERKILVAVNLDKNPKHIKAGLWGSLVAQTCWRLAKEIGKDGEITEAWDEGVIARRSGAWRAEEILRVKEGMRAAVSAGLIDVAADGRVFVHDYLEHQTPGDNAGRLRAMRYRDQKRRGDA